jgi:sialic acid synthase SpsE
MLTLQIGRRTIGSPHPTYFVADIAANHDGSLERAQELIRRAADVGADAAKFQNFRAPKIVSARGFEMMGDQLSHQAKWRKSVYQVYADASVPWEWTAELKHACAQAGIDYFSTPYDLEAVDMLDPFVDTFKIGSGDITWTEMLEHVARKGKPVMLATGASTLEEVRSAVATVREHNRQLVLMQCNTNYTASLENFRHIHLNVLKTFAREFPDVMLGLSDHTPGHATTLGAVALGARVIEKHFTDDTGREGPDHAFSMDPTTWREMVDRTRELELALGDPVKRLEPNESETVIIQRRGLRAARDLAAGTVLTRELLDVLRPAIPDGIAPNQLPGVLGCRLSVSIAAGEPLRWSALHKS